VNPRHLKNLNLLREDVRKKNKIRDKYKRERIKSVSSAQRKLADALRVLGKRNQFKVALEREIYTKEGVRFVDIFIKKFGLAIEVDGGYHMSAGQKESDKKRDKEIWDKKHILIIRFSNHEIRNELDKVLNKIESTINEFEGLSNWKSPGKGVKRLRNTLARKAIKKRLGFSGK